MKKDNILSNDNLYIKLKELTHSSNENTYLREVQDVIYEASQNNNEILGEVYFRPVINEIAELIEKRICPTNNNNSIFQIRLGLFRKYSYIPFAYLSFNYKSNNLVGSSYYFYFDNCPKNSVGLLHNKCIKYINDYK